MDLIHVNLAVADVERSVAFYPEQLRFKQTLGFEADGTVHRYVSADNGVELQLSESGETGGDTIDHVDGLQHLAAGVDDVDTAFDRIDHHGVIKEPGDQPAAGARTAFVLDPDGYTVELVEPLDE
ncbi:MAG: lactoylglutathione lyase [Natronomonas sp.]|jgi:lactoylglutathione lyase